MPSRRKVGLQAFDSLDEALDTVIAGAKPSRAKAAGAGLRCLVLRLPCLPLPALAANMRGERWGKARAVEEQAEAWGWRLKEARAQDEPPFDGPVHVRITVCGTGRRTDPSNWAGHGGLKVLLDCLTPPRAKKVYGIGLIRGDGCKDIAGYEAAWGGADGEPETVIEIREVE